VQAKVFRAGKKKAVFLEEKMCVELKQSVVLTALLALGIAFNAMAVALFGDSVHVVTVASFMTTAFYGWCSIWW
jgi:hypothetical protein